MPAVQESYLSTPASPHLYSLPTAAAAVYCLVATLVPQEADPDGVDSSFSRLFKINRPEWGLAGVGVASSCALGGQMPGTTVACWGAAVAQQRRQQQQRRRQRQQQQQALPGHGRRTQASSWSECLQTKHATAAHCPSVAFLLPLCLQALRWPWLASLRSTSSQTQTTSSRAAGVQCLYCAEQGSLILKQEC